MKFKVTMKDPDGVYECVQEAVRKDVADVGLNDDAEREAVFEKRMETVKAITAKWFEYDEYLTVEIDTDAGTCVVVPK